MFLPDLYVLLDRSDDIDSKPLLPWIHHTSPIGFLLAALVNINTLSFNLNTVGSNMENVTKPYLALPLVSFFSDMRPCSTQLITSLQTCSSAISIMLYGMYLIYSTFKLDHSFIYLIELSILIFLLQWSLRHV